MSSCQSFLELRPTHVSCHLARSHPGPHPVPPQFLALWDVFMHTDSTRCVVSLIICGFPGEPAAAVRRTQPGVVPHLLRCAVAGAPGSGKHRVMAAVAAQSMRQGTTVPMVKQPRACARVTVGVSSTGSRRQAVAKGHCPPSTATWFS